MGIDNVYGLGGLRPGVTTSSARPASPFEGQLIYETDTDLVLAWNGSAWKPLGSLKASTNTSILQVVQTVKTDTYSSTATNAWTDITGYNVAITPSSTSSKVLVLVSLQATPFRTGAGGSARSFRLLRGSTNIGIADTAGNRTSASFMGAWVSDQTIPSLNFTYLDNPNTTSSTTYKVQWFQDSAITFGVNRSEADTDSAFMSRVVSTITAIEVAG